MSEFSLASQPLIQTHFNILFTAYVHPQNATERLPRMTRSSWIAAAFILTFCFQAFFAIPKLSATADEPLHLASGYSYWVTRDFRMEPETPPTAKLVAAFPLLFLHPKLDTSRDEWIKGTRAQSLFGFIFLYLNDADRLLYWARVAMTILAAGGAAIAFLWARDLFGPAAGVFAAGLYSFSPNLLAHGMLVTSDVPVSVFTLLTLYLFWKGSHQTSWLHDLLTGLALGAAMTAKFSATILPVILAVLAFARFGRNATKRLAVMAIGSLIVIEAAYLFSASPLLYFRNLAVVNSYVIKDYPIYLFGHLKPGGYWYYFLAAFAVKATVPTLILIVLAGIHTIVKPMNRWGETILLVGIGAFLVITSAVAGQIGIRYLLPIFPLIFVWVSRIVPDLLALRAGKIILGLLFAWTAISCLHAFPNYIPYFNELAGGAARGTDFLDDSNVDWGQGVKQAAEYARARHLDRLTMFTFSPLDNPQYYGLPRNLAVSEVPGRLFGKRPDPGVYIISAHRVIRMRQVDPAWKIYKPADRIGESLWVYEF